MRSEDPHLQVGAVILREDNSVASIGYNGAPAGVAIPWADRENRRELVIHAEVNAFRYCTMADTRGGLIAVTGTPCPSCLTSIAAHGITRVYFRDLLENYPIDRSIAVAKQLGLHLAHIP